MLLASLNPSLKLTIPTTFDQEPTIGINLHRVSENGFSTASFSFAPVSLREFGVKQKVFAKDRTSIDIDSNRITSTYFTLQGHGDVVGDIYDIDESEDNWIIISDWNIETGEVEGEFQVKYSYALTYNSDEKVFPSDPDTFSITSASIHTKVLEL